MSPSKKKAKGLEGEARPQLSCGDVIRRALIQDARLKGSGAEQVSASAARQIIKSLAAIRSPDCKDLPQGLAAAVHTAISDYKDLGLLRVTYAAGKKRAAESTEGETPQKKTRNHTFYRSPAQALGDNARAEVNRLGLSLDTFDD